MAGVEVMAETRRSKRIPVVFALVALVLVAGIIAMLVRRPAAPRAVVVPPTTTTSTTTTTTAPKPIVPVSTALATPTGGAVPTFDAPGGAQVGTAGTWYGYHMTMPVLEQRGTWLQIRLPERPNGSTAWVRSEDVTMSATPYRIVVNLATTSLTVYQAGFPLFTAPAGIGVDRTPTPPGSFFVAVVENPGPHGYGPIVLDTSGHSEAIQSWEGSGDAITAIHGPITAAADAAIGTTGTQISNGCIRLHEEDQLKLDVIPAGTPVDIVA